MAFADSKTANSKCLDRKFSDSKYLDNKVQTKNQNHQFFGKIVDFQ